MFETALTMDLVTVHMHAGLDSRIPTKTAAHLLELITDVELVWVEE